MADVIRLGINGAIGRMGQRIVDLAHQDPQLEVAAAMEASQCTNIGQDAGEGIGIGSIGVSVQKELSGHVDVVIDFSTPEGLIAIANVCRERSIPLVAATTGLSDDQCQVVHRVAHSTPVILAPNMSLAVNLTMKLVRDAAAALNAAPDGVDVEIIERHHRFKEDAPSGTGDRDHGPATRLGTMLSARVTTLANTRSFLA